MTVYLESHYRSWLFCKAYVNSGESLGGLAKDLGYKGSGRNGNVRDMWLGIVGIPEEKFMALCKIAEVSTTDASSYSILKEKASTLNDWIPIIKLFKQFDNPSPDIFLIKK